MSPPGGAEPALRDQLLEHRALIHFARKVNVWAANQSRLRGRDVTFAEVFYRWCEYVHPEPWKIYEAVLASSQRPEETP
jgi:hypothetical protein